MKKSEMVQKLMVKMANEMNLDMFNKKYRDQVIMILDYLEEQGMMPPDTGKGGYTTTQYTSSSSDYSKEKDYRWDKE